MGHGTPMLIVFLKISKFVKGNCKFRKSGCFTYIDHKVGRLDRVVPLDALLLPAEVADGPGELKVCKSQLFI